MQIEETNSNNIMNPNEINNQKSSLQLQLSQVSKF